MEEYTKSNDLRVQCNIELKVVHNLSIHECIGSHAKADVTALIAIDDCDVIYSELNSQPIKIFGTENGKESLLFYGIIRNVTIGRESEYIFVHIAAHSLTWMMDLEKKNRSFQGIGNSVDELLKYVTREHSFQIRCSADNQKIMAPFIQYRETDWEFILRLSSHLNAPVLTTSNYDSNVIYIGFPEPGKELELEVSSVVYGMDAKDSKYSNWRTWQAAYYNISTNQICHIGDRIRYQNRLLRVHEAFMFLQHGMLQCTYRLADPNYHPVAPIFNPYLKGISFTGKVLERQDEHIRVHLDIDDEQDINRAYFYPWMPEYGNMLYCMPEPETIIRLLIPEADEREAIGIQCVRQNGAVCGEIQNPDDRWFAISDDNKMVMRPGTLELSAENSRIALLDSSGAKLCTEKELLVQAKGSLKVIGKNVLLKAPQEITAVRRDVAAPSVINICHNLDSMGQYTSFKNLEELRITDIPESGSGYQNKNNRVTATAKERWEDERKKLEFKLKELMEEENKNSDYQLDSSIMNVLAAIPQSEETDELSRIAIGFRPILGQMKGE